jgi:uncharacterized Zn finger protein
MSKKEKTKDWYRCPQCGSGSFESVKMNRTLTEVTTRCKGCGRIDTQEMHWPGRSKRQK